MECSGCVAADRRSPELCRNLSSQTWKVIGQTTSPATFEWTNQIFFTASPASSPELEASYWCFSAVLCPFLKEKWHPFLIKPMLWQHSLPGWQLLPVVFFLLCLLLWLLRAAGNTKHVSEIESLQSSCCARLALSVIKGKKFVCLCGYEMVVWNAGRSMSETGLDRKIKHWTSTGMFNVKQSSVKSVIAIVWNHWLPQ